MERIHFLKTKSTCVDFAQILLPVFCNSRGNTAFFKEQRSPTYAPGTHHSSVPLYQSVPSAHKHVISCLHLENIFSLNRCIIFQQPLNFYLPLLSKTPQQYRIYILPVLRFTFTLLPISVWLVKLSIPWKRHLST